MYDIVINETIETKGLISFIIAKDEEGNLAGEGVLKTHLYIEEINTLDCDNFAIYDIDVISESFGSSDPCIIYRFTFKDFETSYEYNEYTEEQLIEIYNKESE